MDCKILSMKESLGRFINHLSMIQIWVEVSQVGHHLSLLCILQVMVQEEWVDLLCTLQVTAQERHRCIPLATAHQEAKYSHQCTQQAITHIHLHKCLQLCQIWMVSIMCQPTILAYQVNPDNLVNQDNQDSHTR
jgi:hypothetical protein